VRWVELGAAVGTTEAPALVYFEAGEIITAAGGCSSRVCKKLSNMGKSLQQQMQELHLKVEGSSQLKSTPTFFATNPKASKRFKRVCVFCGSSSGNGTVFSNVALDLGRELVSILIISGSNRF
jgi:hypothetical protein